MKQNKQVKKVKEKDNYLKSTFLFPVTVSLLDVAVMIAAFSMSAAGDTSSTAMLFYQAATVLTAFSPSVLLVTAYMSLRHTKKYPDGSAFYKKMPMRCSLLVWGMQTLYMVTLTGV